MSHKIVEEKNDATYACTAYLAPDVEITSIRNPRSFMSGSNISTDGDMNEETESWD